MLKKVWGYNMLEKLKNYIIGIISVVAGVLAVLFAMEKRKRQKVEIENLGKDLDIKDASLKERQAHAEANKQQTKESLESIPKPSAEELTPDQVKKYWNKE